MAGNRSHAARCAVEQTQPSRRRHAGSKQNILDLFLVPAEPQDRWRRARVRETHLFEGLCGQRIAVGDAGDGFAPVQDDEMVGIVGRKKSPQVRIVDLDGSDGMADLPQGLDQLLRRRHGFVLFRGFPRGVDVEEAARADPAGSAHGPMPVSSIPGIPRRAECSFAAACGESYPFCVFPSRFPFE